MTVFVPCRRQSLAEVTVSQTVVAELAVGRALLARVRLLYLLLVFRHLSKAPKRQSLSKSRDRDDQPIVSDESDSGENGQDDLWPHRIIGIVAGSEVMFADSNLNGAIMS